MCGRREMVVVARKSDNSRFYFSHKVEILTEGEKTLSLNLTEKKAVVAEVSAQVAQAQAIVLAEYRGIGVSDMTVLRADARSSGVYLRVLKNTLVRRAVEGTPFAALANEMVGPLVFGISTDPVAAAKVMNNFAKVNGKFVIKAGAVPNQMMDVAGVQALASTLSREELLAKFARTLNEVPTKFARALAAVRDAKEAA
ncbi:50S ribosomal protein L10 [mine drainage metagenome]|uniref:50S ribosomal protein L10 n=1 Tax=mine drainage metagenome TaxID=410659 RepID=A0A1J5STA7_9ZZZZ